MSSTVSPAEALRMLIRTRDPELADKAVSLEAVRKLQDITAPDNKTGRTLAAAWTALYDGVKAGRIRLRGVFRSNDLPFDIENSEQAVGTLNIWEQTLDCTPSGMKEKRIYRNVSCIKTDVNNLLTKSAPKKTGRTPHNWSEIESAAHRLLDKRGQFDANVKDWNCRARLEELLCDEFGIGRTQLAKHLPGMIDRWMKVGK